MVRVTIDGELTVDALRVLSERWNGFAVPMFSDEQRAMVLAECVRLGWDGADDGWQWVDGAWMVSGWCWLEVDYRW